MNESKFIVALLLLVLAHLTDYPSAKNVFVVLSILWFFLSIAGLFLDFLEENKKE